jgi:hypothetical protein
MPPVKVKAMVDAALSCAALVLGLMTTSVADASQAPASRSPDPYVQTDPYVNPHALGRRPPTIGLAADGRLGLINLHWLVWTSAGFNSVAFATGTEERWQCPTSTCPLDPSAGGYVNYPVNVILEWPEGTFLHQSTNGTYSDPGFLFSELVVSSPSLGTKGFPLEP